MSDTKPPIPLSEYVAFIGIDWADEKHAVCLSTGSQQLLGSVAQKAADLEAWAAELRQRFGGRPIAVCLEQSRGVLIYALLKYEFLILFPINPKQLARYREALFPCGAKDDPTDAQLLCDFVRLHHAQLRAWKADDQSTRTLRLLVEDRRTCVDERTALKNRLKQRLKEFFPLALELAGNALDADWFLRLLGKFPSHAELRRASPEALLRILPKLRRLSDSQEDPHHAAIRSLAFKWLRVIYRCWTTGKPYVEETHLANLRNRNSPLIKFLEETATKTQAT